MDPLIFISHCDEDKRFSGELISLLQRVGIPDEYIFSYSSPAHGLSLGENIYEGLRNRLIHDQKTFVIFLLSKDFYRSVDCLNEMGAAWITSKKTVGVLIPPFDFSQVKGVIEKGNIHMRVNEKLKLNELRDMLASFGNLPLKQGTSWEIIRDDFIDKVDSILNQDNLLTEFEEELKRI